MTSLRTNGCYGSRRQCVKCAEILKMSRSNFKRTMLVYCEKPPLFSKAINIKNVFAYKSNNTKYYLELIQSIKTKQL